MHPLMHAPLVAAVGGALMLFVSQVQALVRPVEPATLAAPTVDVARPTKAEAAAPGLVASVVKANGAALRVAPSSEAAPLGISDCGDIWPVLAVDGGWVKVKTFGGVAWIGGARVSVGSEGTQPACSDARPFLIGGSATTFVSAGCLSLRTRPSREANVLDCVNNGHVYSVVDGPFDPGTGEDWIKVTSANTGTGWALAEHLYPS